MRDQLILVYSYLHGTWQYRWMALLLAFIVAIAGWAVVYTLPDRYTSRAVVHVDTTSMMQPLLRGLSVETDTDRGLNIMSQTLLSRENLEDVIRHADMDLGVDDKLAMDKLVSGMRRSIELKYGGRQRGNNIYELSYIGKTPELTYQVVSRLLNTLIEHTLDSTRTDTVEAQQFIDRQISEHETRLATAEQKLADFKRENVGFMPDERGGYYGRLQAEQDELDNIRSQLRLAERRHSAMLKQLEGEAPLLASHNFGEPKAQKLRAYREQLAALLTRYKEQHPDVKALRAMMEELMASDDASANMFIGAGSGDSTEFNPVYQELKAEIHKASVDVETLKIKLLEQKSKVLALQQAVDIIPGVEAELAKLNRDYDVTRERYLGFIERRETARLAQAVGQAGSNIKFRIIEPPRVPLKPSAPNRFLFLTGAFLVAIGAGLAWGFFRYLLRPAFIDSSQIIAKTGMPVLGSVGLYLNKQHKRKRRLQMSGFLLAFFLLVAAFGAALVFRDSSAEILNALTLSVANLMATGI